MRNQPYNRHMNIRQVIADSYRDALKSHVMGTSPRALARARERAFVKALAERLQDCFAQDDVRVFSAYGRRNVDDFGSEQLLFDIAVCRAAYGQTAERTPEDFVYIAETLWAIELNFEREWRAALYAINRLNVGAAANMLLIAAQPKSARESFIESLKAPFAAPADAGGERYLSLVPHPAEWDETDDSPETWRLNEGEWEEA